jgi:hypothetical protein
MKMKEHYCAPLMLCLAKIFFEEEHSSLFYLGEKKFYETDDWRSHNEVKKNNSWILFFDLDFRKRRKDNQPNDI